MNVKKILLEEFKKPETWRALIFDSMVQIIFFLSGFICGMITLLWLIKIIFA